MQVGGTRKIMSGPGKGRKRFLWDVKGEGALTGAKIDEKRFLTKSIIARGKPAFPSDHPRKNDVWHGASKRFGRPEVGDGWADSSPSCGRKGKRKLIRPVDTTTGDFSHHPARWLLFRNLHAQNCCFSPTCQSHQSTTS